MIQFKYTAMNLQQEKFQGTFIAEDEFDLAIQLQKQGLYLVSCKNYDGNVKAKFFSLSTGKVTQGEINTFCRQFAIMINAGISILGCLDILKNQKYSDMFRDILTVLDDDVRGGMMFSEALNKHKKVFPSFFRSMIAVGEKSGKMEVVLNSLADYYEADAAQKRKVKAAFSYPIMLGIMTIGIVIVMLAFVVPTFRKSLSSLEVNPTGLTKAVYDISDFIVDQGLNVLAILIAILALLFLYSRTQGGRFAFDKMKMTFPGLKKISIARITARFASAFGLLLTSGMDIVDALEAANIVFDNKYVEQKYAKAVEDVKHGVSLAVAFDKYKVFPDILNQMIGVGEKTNSLDDVLNRSGSFFNDQVDSAIASITSKIQPIMLGLMGAIVGTLFIAIYSPMLDIMQSF